MVCHGLAFKTFYHTDMKISWKNFTHISSFSPVVIFPCLFSVLEHIYFYIYINLFIYLFLAELGLCCRARAFSSCGKRGLLFIEVCGLLTAVVSLVAEHGLQARGLSSCGLRALERRLSSCGARTQLLRDTWDLPGPGLEPVSPALAGRFLTTAPPGKSGRQILNRCTTREAQSLNIY